MAEACGMYVVAGKEGQHHCHEHNRCWRHSLCGFYGHPGSTGLVNLWNIWYELQSASATPEIDQYRSSHWENTDQWSQLEHDQPVLACFAFS